MDGPDDLRVTRRRMRIAAAVAVLAVGLTIPLLRTPLEPQENLELRPDVGVFERPVVYDVDFADPRHGFALWGRCTNGQDFRCERKLLVTEDGVTWTPRPFAIEELANPAHLAGRLIALGPGRILLTDLDSGGPRNRYFSGDSGHSWDEVPSSPDGPITELPPGALLETVCVETVHDLSECRRRRLLVTLPDTGRRLRLTSPVGQPWPEPRAAADGSWWVTGKINATGQWAAAISRDGAKTWSVSPLPIEPGTVLHRLSVAGSGATVYLLATGPIPYSTEPSNLVAIFRSADGGQTWEQTWRTDGGSPRTLGGTAIVAPDGALYVAPADTGPTYRSHDGGHTFTPVRGGPRLASVRRTMAGYLALPQHGPPGQYLTSADGTQWTNVPLP